MTLCHPFQKLCTIHLGNDKLLLAASGSTINSINLTDGKVLHQWPSQLDDSDNELLDGDENRPNKRRKLDLNGQTSLSRQQSETSDASIEIVAERKKGERKKSKFIDTKLPYVSHLLATPDQKHVIAVTAEDKAIRVFKISAKGKLKLLSQRSLPKKLCAIQLTKDQKTILAADKFGDVYAVPFHQSADWKPKKKTDDVYKPSATNLTVHTKGNLEALQQQLEQKHHQARKEGPEFEHQVLLGHVSLLTDLLVAEGVVDGISRPFILTSDRDEHIRVSRGIPQAHVIENFCLGHEDFVTKLCIPAQKPDILVAGNGEATLRVYQWQIGSHLQAIPIKSIVREELEQQEPNGGAQSQTWDKLVVSGIWSMSHPETDGFILVAIEGLPLLLTFAVTTDGLSHVNTLKARGNILDVSVLDSTGEALVSIDNVHASFSTTTYREDADSQVNPLELLRLQVRDEKARWDAVTSAVSSTAFFDVLPHVSSVTTGENERTKGNEKLYSFLGESLYGLENLRKKRDVTAEEEAATDAEEEADNLKLEDM